MDKLWITLKYLWITMWITYILYINIIILK
nr:MAG TPA: hypothetical protein [Caudoviricetes sp.]